MSIQMCVIKSFLEENNKWKSSLLKSKDLTNMRQITRAIATSNMSGKLEEKRKKKEPRKTSAFSKRDLNLKSTFNMFPLSRLWKRKGQNHACLETLIIMT